MVVCENPRIELIRGDCNPALKGMGDNQFDLAIVDPPYFTGPEKRKYYGSEYSSHGVKRIDYKPLENSWVVPGSDYFNELIRVSKNQIIWGVNYFDFPFGPGRIIWDKCNQTSSFSDCEIAYTNLHKSVRKFVYMWHGMMQGKSPTEGHIMQGKKSLNEKKIHPTQKPVVLYKWLLSKYAKPGNTILDTHGGSMSLAIACYDMGFDLTCYELDKDYYQDAVERLREHMRQTDAFKENNINTYGKQLSI